MMMFQSRMISLTGRWIGTGRRSIAVGRRMLMLALQVLVGEHLGEEEEEK